MAVGANPWKRVSPMLAYSCFCLLIGDMLFGYDTSSFGGMLANPGFINQFGKLNEATGKYAFDSLTTSLLSSLAFIGKFIGCATAGTIIEHFGHRMCFYILSVVSVVGIILEIASAGTGHGTGKVPMFIVGRIIVYISVGLVEVCVTTYQSEIVPGPLRGFVIVSLQLFLGVGGLLATGVNKAFSTHTSSSGWKTVVGIQFAFPVLIAIFVYFIPDSPRWLLSKDRDHDALIALRRLRVKQEVEDGRCEEELALIKDSLSIHVHKAGWVDVFKGSNFRRTLIVLVAYTFQQITGQAFVSTYQTVFYKTNGYAAQAFLYPIINAVLGILAVIPGMILVDRMGRRGLLMLSCGLQALWMFLLAGFGSKSHKNDTTKNAVVAFFMLFSLSYNMGGASVPYLLGAEIPNASVREKTDAIGTAWNVLWAFATNFSLPYILADLSFKTGWIFGAISMSAVFYWFFFLPETKGKALEEIDALFEKPFNPFKKTAQPNAQQSALGDLERNADHYDDAEGVFEHPSKQE